MRRLIDANALIDDLKASARGARERKEETQDEECKIRYDQAYWTFIECALRVKNAPTIESEPVLTLLSKSELREAAMSIREHNRIHSRKEPRAIFITQYLDIAAAVLEKIADGEIAL